MTRSSRSSSNAIDAAGIGIVGGLRRTTGAVELRRTGFVGMEGGFDALTTATTRGVTTGVTVVGASKGLVLEGLLVDLGESRSTSPPTESHHAISSLDGGGRLPNAELSRLRVRGLGRSRWGEWATISPRISLRMRAFSVRLTDRI